MGIKELHIENIRSMFGKYYIPLGQLTVLVGENSSGKTSLLASLAAISGISKNIVSPDFNQKPFQLGSFEDIASYISKKTGRSKTFSLGLLYDEDEGFIAEYQNQNSRPIISKIIAFQNGYIFLARKKDESKWEVSAKNKQRKYFTLKEISDVSWKGNNWKTIKLPFKLSADVPPFYFFARINRNQGLRKFSFLFSESFYVNHIGPIRSKPKRTYEDWMKADEPTAFILERILKGTNKKVVDKIKSFGNESGLFKEVRIKKFGGSRFAITIKQTGPEHNLVDVGYGVSQVLPIIIDVLASSHKSVITMQQPEVHLHPKAQATLASLLIEIVKNTDKQIIVETHSDYFFSRISQEIRKDITLLEKVQLLYFEKKATKTEIYPIKIDKLGNIEDAPSSYREFFLKEELKFLGIEE